MSGIVSDPKEELHQPEDDGSLHHWMMCEDDPDICPKCGKEGGEYTPTLDECAFC
jgi:hypothetical protein